jgi:asparagine synthase (glutamine-hydrolysing)
MSAIGGIIDWSNGVDPAALSSMIAAAPGFTGSNGAAWRDGQAGLVRVALATTPEAVAEVQPWRHAGSGTVICFDGRVDNREELRALIGREAPPDDAPDCAIVLAGWQLLGERLLDRLAGDYAFAIWNAGSRRLTCVRSPVGWRPLLWTTVRGGVAFATEPAMLIRGLRLSPGIDQGSVGEYLSLRFLTDTATFWKGIHRLPPGHLLEADDRGIRSRRWLEGPFEDHSRLSDSDHVERFRYLFDQALVATARSTGPVAAHLSGGLDSSSIVCRSRHLVEAGKLATMPNALSVRFPGEQCDEGDWIAAVEERCGVRTHAITGAPYDWSAAAAWSAQTYHLPLRPNTAGTIVESCNWLRGNGISVLLTGEGGDEWLSGKYSHFPDLLRAGRLPALLREGLSAGSGTTFGQKLRWTLSSSVGPLVSRRRLDAMLHPHLDFTLPLPAWIAPDWARRIDLTDRWRDAAQAPALPSLTQRERYAHFALARRHVNIDNVLCWTAGRQVELRHPFHDFRLASFLMGAAGGMLRRGGVRKHLLREAMRDTLPDPILHRRDKAEMTAPIYDAIADRLRHRPIRDLICVREGWVDPAVLAGIEQQHRAWRTGQISGPSPRSALGAVWSALAIDVLLEQAADLV